MPHKPVLFRKLKWKSLWSRVSDLRKRDMLLVFTGYMLSPFSPYNDLVVNILPSYLLAVLTSGLTGMDVLTLTLFYYIGSNILGILLMIIGFRKLSPSVQYRPSRKQLLFGLFYIALIIAGVIMIGDVSEIKAYLKRIIDSVL